MTMNNNETAAHKAVARLRERNVKMESRMASAVRESLRRKTQESFRIDIDSDEMRPMFDLTDPGFSIKAFREAAYELASRSRIYEANAEGALQQLLRSGISTSINAEYASAVLDTNYQEIVTVLPTTQAVALFAPLYRAGFMQPLDPLEEPSEDAASGSDISIKPHDFGKIFKVSKNVMDDDQTGQLSEQATQIGQNGAILKDSRVWVRLIGKAGTDAGGSAVSASQTGAMAGESTWPWNTSFTLGGGQNRLTAYSVPTYQSLVTARVLGRKMKDPKGNRMAVNFDTLFCGVGVSDAIHEMVDSDSMFFPSTASIKAVNAGAAGSDTGAGTTHAKNVLKGKYKVTDSVWLPDTAWGLAAAGKGFTLVQREPLSVLMESPSAGQSFAMRVHRWNIHERYEVDWREPRFAVLGNDGTAT